MNIKGLIKGTLTAALVSYSVAGQAQTATLSSVLAEALDKHPEVLRARAQAVEGERLTDAARAGYLPTLDLTADVGIEQVNNSSTRARGEQNQSWNRSRVGFEARQMLFDGYGTHHELKRNEHYTAARKLELAAVRENVALTIAQAYLELLKQRALYELALENLENHEEIYGRIESRVQQGVGTQADLSQIASRLNSSNANFVVAENNLADAETDYQRAVGALPPESIAEFELNEMLLPETLADAEDAALTSNFTVLASVVDIEEARSQYKGTESSNYPSVDLVVSGDYGNDIGGTEGVDENYSAVLELSWNVFNGGADKANSRAAQQQVEQAKAVSADAVRQAKQGVRLSWSAYDSVSRQRDFLSEYVNAAEATRNAYTKEFNLGKRTLIDLLDSENEVFRSNGQYLDAHYTYEAAKVRILNAIGKLSAALITSS